MRVACLPAIQRPMDHGSPTRCGMTSHRLAAAARGWSWLTRTTVRAPVAGWGKIAAGFLVDGQVCRSRAP